MSIDESFKTNVPRGGMITRGYTELEMLDFIAARIACIILPFVTTKCISSTIFQDGAITLRIW